MNMAKKQRQQYILQLLEDNNIMMISALAELLQCSMMTVRRDIDEMESQELVVKAHGSVLLNNNRSGQPSHFLRVNQNVEEKKRIGAEAVKLIEDGKSVFFDGGSTTYYVACSIPNKLSFSAITNSLMTAVELCQKPNVNVVMLGGKLYKSSFTTVHNDVIETARKFRTDLAFISTKAVMLPDGLFETELSLIEIKKIMLERTDKAVLIADHTKFSDSALCMSVSMADIDHLITNREISKEYLEELQQLGISYTLA